MDSRKYSPELARQELQRRELARKELEKRQTTRAKDEFIPRMYSPTSALQMAGYETYKNPTARSVAEAEATSLIPPLRIAGKIPGISNLGKSVVNYLTDIAQNATIGGLLGKLHGGSAKEGALESGGATAVVNPIVQTLGSSNPLLRIGAASALGGLGAYGAGKALGEENKYTDIGGALIGGGLALKGKNAKNLAMMNMLKGVHEKDVINNIEASKRLGLPYITPAEATGNPLVGAAQGSLGKTEPGADLFHARSQERLNAEKKSIQELFNNISNPGQKKETQELYQKSYQSFLDPKLVDEFKQSKIINKAFNKVKKDPIYQDALNGVDEHNFAYLDQVKRALDDMREKALRKGENNKARLIGKKTNSLVEKMDEINPDYAQARKNSQRDIIRNELESKLSESELKGTSFYNKFLKNDNKFNKLISDLKNAPEAQQQLKDMKLVFKDLINPISARSAAKLKSTGMSEGRSSKKAIFDFLQNLQGGKYDTAAIELITNPKWNEELSRIKKIKSVNEKTRYLSNAISRAMGEQTNNMMNE